MMRTRAATFGVSLVAAVSAAALGAVPAAAADDVKVSNTETIQAYLDPSGKLDVARVYDQVAMQGNGTVELANPVSTVGLRNLDQFGGFEVKNGEIVGTYDVDGEMRLRSVSTYTEKLPLDVQVTYLLDGKEVQPDQVAGKSGNLEVRYVVTNVTAKPTTLTYDDGTGAMATTTEDVVIPMVGSLTTVLPPSFTNVASSQANMAGDGRGGTKMSFTMTLFGPIGAPQASFGYTARITDGVIPPATITALPVSPLESPSFKGAAASYNSGAETGATLTAGATEIDSNLLKLRDGAGELLAGLIKLSNGANQLNAGLTGTAAPGAAQLANGADQAAAGADELSSGITQLDDGATKLSSGANQVAGGTGQVSDGANALSDGASTAEAGAGQLAGGAAALAVGSDDLAAGAADLADGIDQILAGAEALPTEVAKDPDFQRLKGALAGIQAGIGTASDSTSATLLGGLNLLKYGLRSPLGVANCDTNPDDDTNRADDCGAADGVEIIAGRLEGADPTIQTLGDKAVTTYKSLGCPQNAATPVPPVLPPATLVQLSAPQTCIDQATIAYGLLLPAGVVPSQPDGGLQAQTALAAEKLTRIFEGLDDEAIPGIEAIKRGLSNPGCDPTVTDKTDPKFCGISQAAALVSAGIDQLVQGISDQLVAALEQASAGADQVAGGAAQVAAGAQQLADGSSQLDTGLGALSDGAAALADGAGQVNDGATQVADGSDQLAAGTGQAAAGADKLAAGNELLAVGANKLATGLGDAADGSSQIAQGLGTAAGSAPALGDGAQRLSDEGTKKLIEAGRNTASDYGIKYASLQAGAERAQTEGMAYGAPQNATGSTAYSIELAGVDTASTRNLGRLLAAVVLFGLAAGAVYLRRRPS